MDYRAPKPEHPDPFWPEKQDDGKSLENRVDASQLTTWTCRVCGRHDDRSIKDATLCNKCYTKHAKNSAVATKTNSGWMEQSEAVGLALFERQPTESDLEWMIWSKYRDHYPMRLPTWTELAKEVGCGVAAVLNAANKWSFKVRMQSWARYTDDANLESRAAAIKQMNERQVDMADRLLTKLSSAIDQIDPMLLKPGELVQLMKVATELERRIITATPEKVEGTVATAAQKQSQLTKPEDLSEVVGILAKTGLLPGQGLAVEQTTTTRIVAKGEQTEQEVVVIDSV